MPSAHKLRVLTVVDTFSRFSPVLEPRFTFRGADFVEVLEEVGRQVGFPAAIRVDQGTEFVSRDLNLWAYQRGVVLDFSRPGKALIWKGCTIWRRRMQFYPPRGRVLL